MPPVSQAQRGAMYSAKAGNSTLGIPQKVGAEFVAADKGGKLPKYKSEEKGETKPDKERGRGEPPHFPPLSNLRRIR